MDNPTQTSNVTGTSNVTKIPDPVDAHKVPLADFLKKLTWQGFTMLVAIGSTLFGAGMYFEKYLEGPTIHDLQQENSHYKFQLDSATSKIQNTFKDIKVDNKGGNSTIGNGNTVK